MSKRHTLKSWPSSFQSVWDGVKTFEFRKNDRDFKVGDSLQIEEFYPDLNLHSGRIIGVTIVHILHAPDFGMPEGYCVLGIQVWERKNQI